MEKTIQFNKAGGFLYGILSLFTRNELRNLAKECGVPIGRNKGDTISYLYKHRFQVRKTIIVGIVRGVS